MSANVKRSEKTLICVVDDDFLLRESTKRLLRSFKFNVKALASAEEFLNSECLAATACLILDVRMPGMNGFELLHEIRALGSASGGNVPVIAMTALVTHADCARMLNAGFQACLPKPFTPDKLVETILTLLNN